MLRGSRSVRTLLGAVVILAILLGLAPTPSAAAAGQRWCPQQAAPYCSENAFLDYWQAVDRATGGYALDIIGFPVSPALQMPSGLIVQFYERAIFEWHPKNPVEYQVLLTRLGAFAIETDTRLGLKAQAAKPPEPCPNTNECYLAKDTNHTLRGTFLLYWVANGGLPVFGYPLTEQFQLRYTDGKAYNVQYFERNRFEAHPENTNPRYQVLLGRLGAEELARNINAVKTWKAVATPNYGGSTPPPPATPPPPSASPTPKPSPSPSPPASADQRLVDTAFNLIRSIPDARYITDTLVSRDVRWTFDQTLPDGAWGAYLPRTNTIYYHPVFRTMDPHDLAALTGHEGQHAYDLWTYGFPETVNDCFTLEYRGFLTAAALWRIWYGSNGKANPANVFEREQNAILADILYNNGNDLKRFIVSAYAEQCGASLTMSEALPQSPNGLPVSVGIPASLEGLPALVSEVFPGAAAQLAEIAAGPTLQSAEIAEAAPKWTKR